MSGQCIQDAGHESHVGRIHSMVEIPYFEKEE